jgi:hypothetical protein
MAISLLHLVRMDWPVPDYFTLRRHQKTLAVQAPYRCADRPPNLLVDSIGAAGSAVSERLKLDVSVDALRRAIAARRASPKLIHRSDGQKMDAGSGAARLSQRRTVY